jgi:hypothetical protein
MAVAVSARKGYHRTMKTSLPKLKKKLDAVFSQYIRLRDSDSSGFFSCITCGERVFWKNGQNCHYRPRNKLALRFDETNCNAGCASCNLWDRDHIQKYTLAIQDKYGDRVLAELDKKLREKITYKRADYEDMIQKYTALRDEMQELKGL